MATSPLAIALRWYDQGITPIPCFPQSKRPMAPWAKWQDQRPDRSKVLRWFRRSAGLNLGLVTGNGFFVLDFDSIPAYYKWKNNYNRWAQSYTVQTSRGRHVYFKTDSVVSTMALNGIDVLGSRHLVMAPPSIHPSGAQYQTWLEGEILSVPTLETIIEIPEKVADETRSNFDFMLLPPQVRFSGNGIVSQVKRELPLLRFLSLYTTPIPSSRDGRWYIMRCPNPSHYDKCPSFWADAYFGICGCFKPACQSSQPNGKPMDVINLVAWMENVSNDEALDMLAREVGVK